MKASPQLNPILNRISQLEISIRDGNLKQLSLPANTAPTPSQAPTITGKEDTTSFSSEAPANGRADLPAVTTADRTVESQTGGNKKKKKTRKKGKTNEGQAPPLPVPGQPPKGREGDPRTPSQPLRSQSRPSRKENQPSASPSKKRDAVLETRGNNPPTPTGRRVPDKGTTAPANPIKETAGEWSLVVRKKNDGGKGRGKPAPQGAAPPRANNPPKERGNAAPSRQVSAQVAPPSTRRKGRRRVPRTAAVVITCPPGQYRDNLRLATEQIDPASLGITGMTARKAVTGAQIFEIGGPEKQEKADALAERIREVLANKEGVKVTRPSATAEIRIRDLHDAITEADVQRAIALATGCDPESVTVGPIRSTGRGMGTAWTRCQLAAANKVAAAGKLLVGWTKVRVEALEKRPLQCYKCLGKGHVRAQCNSEADRSACCYKCGKQGHVARDCTLPVHCPMCADLGRPAGHRAGTRACTAPKKKNGGGNKKVPPPPASNTPATETRGSGEARAIGGEEAMEVETPLPQRQPRERESTIPVGSPEEMQNPPPEEHMEVMLEEQGRQT